MQDETFYLLMISINKIQIEIALMPMLKSSNSSFLILMLLVITLPK